jgi:hypothetical protein
MNKQKPAHGVKSLTSNLCLESGMGLVVYKCKEYKEEGKRFHQQDSLVPSMSSSPILDEVIFKVTLSLRPSLTL